MKDSSKKPDHEMHSQEIKEIITKVPSWIIRWGLTIYFLILILVIGLSNIIAYPEYVRVQFTLKASNPAKPILAMTAGNLVNLLVNENDEVTFNQPLAYIESDTDINQVVQYLSKLEQLRVRITRNIPVETEFLDHFDASKFGQLQSQFHRFFIQYKIWSKCSSNNGSVELKSKKAQLAFELNGNKEINKNLDECDLDFLNSLNDFIGDIQTSNKQFILTANSTGRVKFVKMLRVNEFVQAGQEIFHVEPIDNRFFGEVNIPQATIHKISIGQDVIIKYVDYPFQQFGIQKGKIVFISGIANNDGYLASVELDQTINTLNENKIHLRPGILADAEILTKDESIFQRIINSFF